MDKKITIILAVLTCICMVACALCISSAIGAFGQEDGDPRLIGRWEFSEVNISITFDSDHTGRFASLDDDEDGVTIRWSYDQAADVYNIYMEGKAYTYFGYFDADGSFVYNGQTATKAK